MFVQVIQGTLADEALYRRQMDRWDAELRAGAAGYLGSTGGVTPDGRVIGLVRFDSKEAAQANSTRPEQGAWWNETEKAFADVTFHDCIEVDVLNGGGSDDAGFVQVIQGRAKDPAAMRAMANEIEPRVKDRRPDILGMLVAWHDDGSGFTEAVYFRSEAETRQAEQATADDEVGRRFMESFDGEPVFFDLPNPDLRS